MNYAKELVAEALELANGDKKEAEDLLWRAYQLIQEKENNND